MFEAVRKLGTRATFNLFVWTFATIPCIGQSAPSGSLPSSLQDQKQLDPASLLSVINGGNDKKDRTIVDQPAMQAIEKQNSKENAETTAVKSGVKLEPPNEFQDFIYVTTGQKLPMFGEDLFVDVPTTFAPVDHIPVTSDYVIGPGDEILMKAWGQVDIDHRTVVDRSGNIFIPRVGTVSVAGIKYGQLQGYLKSSVGKIFQNFDLAVSLGQLRSIQVFFVGQARRPGSYTVGSLSTLVNAIFACGGISSRGSLRDIQLKRNGTTVTELDLYDLLTHGDKSKDVSLLPGDVIYVPPVGQLVALEGSVNEPAVYELKRGTSLADVIGYAGGLTPTAAGKNATIERIHDRTIRDLQDVKLDSEGLKTTLQDGDLVTIRSLSARFENAVTLRGNVATPGRFPWHQGMKIKDLIPNREALVTRDYWLYANEMGRIKDRTFWTGAARSIDSLKGDTTQQTIQKVQAAGLLAGADTKEDEFGTNAKTDPGAMAGMVSSDTGTQISRGVPEINWGYAVVQRFDWDDLTSKLVPFNLGKAIIDSDPAENIDLMPGDIITIFSQSDIRTPLERQTKYVRLEGEFRVPGIYQVVQGETLRSLVQRAGGFTGNAYLFGSEFTRESNRKSQQKQLDDFVRRLDRDVERNASISSQNVVSAEEAATLKEKLEAQRNFVEKLHQLKANGRVVLGLPATANNISDLPELPLEDGDVFTVPYTPGSVNVIGAVYNDNSYIYYPTRSISFYLSQAGRGTRDADIDHIFVVRADGSIANKSRSSGWFAGFGGARLMPGDTIVVPEKISKVGFVKSLKDFSQILSQFGLGAAAIITLTQ